MAIARTIAMLNELPQPAGLFTEDSNGAYLLEGLLKGRPVSVRVLANCGPLCLDTAAPATVTISHEPWGEATVDIPGATPRPGLEIINPRVVSYGIGILATGLALVEGSWTYQNGFNTQTVPLLFVLKKEGDNWKIASLRLMAR